MWPLRKFSPVFFRANNFAQKGMSTSFSSSKWDFSYLKQLGTYTSNLRHVKLCMLVVTYVVQYINIITLRHHNQGVQNLVLRRKNVARYICLFHLRHDIYWQPVTRLGASKGHSSMLTISFALRSVLLFILRSTASTISNVTSHWSSRGPFEFFGRIYISSWYTVMGSLTLTAQWCQQYH